MQLPTPPAVAGVELEITDGVSTSIFQVGQRLPRDYSKLKLRVRRPHLRLEIIQLRNEESVAHASML